MGKRLTKTKAKKILRDNEIKDKPLTAKQEKFFGFIAGGGTSRKLRASGGTS